MHSLVSTLAVAATFAVAALSTSVSRAEILFSNFTTGDVGTVLLETGTAFALGFSTGTSSGPQLEVASIDLRLYAQSGTASPVLGLFTNSSGNPGTLITTFSAVSVSSTTATAYTFTPSSALTLSAGTDYWAVLGISTSTPLSWVTMNEEATLKNGSGYVFVQAKRSTNSGSTWSNSIGASAAAFQIQAVPEPSTIVMACIGVAGAGVLDSQRRRRRRVTDGPRINA